MKKYLQSIFIMPVVLFLRYISKTRFKILGLATIINIPTEEFNTLLEDFQSKGWIKKSEYAGFDAWIDYGFMKLKKNSIVLKFEWDNYEEGSVEGPKNIIKKLANELGYSVHSANRWDKT